MNLNKTNKQKTTTRYQKVATTQRSKLESIIQHVQSEMNLAKLTVTSKAVTHFVTFIIHLPHFYRIPQRNIPIVIHDNRQMI